MNIHNLNKDVCGGALAVLGGIAVAVYASSLTLGTLRQMGPGYFPFALGVLLTLTGIVIAIRGYLASPSRTTCLKLVGQPRAEWRAWLLIGLSLVAFIAIARHLGLAVATFAVVFISALADRENSWRSALLVAGIMVAVSIIVFWWALQIQLPIFAWRLS